MIAGVGEGWLQETPWEALPLTRNFVKEWLALASFSSFSCSTLSSSSLWFSNTGSGSNLTFEAHTINFERSTVLGCHCTGWKEGAVGTLACKEGQSKEGSSLQQELKVLNYILSGLSAENQAYVLAGSVRALHCNFVRIDLSS